MSWKFDGSDNVPDRNQIKKNSKKKLVGKKVDRENDTLRLPENMEIDLGWNR